MSQPSTVTHFDVSQLPSLKDGMSVEEESQKRRKTCRFIEEAGRLLKLPRIPIATAMVFFHRFYAKHSFSEHDRFEVAVASIVLAAKTEESPKKLNTVIEECYKLKLRGMQAGRISTTGSMPVPSSSSSSSSTSSLDPKSEEFLKLKERILLLERVILHTIGFELSIDHPYKFLVEHIKKLVQMRLLEYTENSSNPDHSATTASSSAGAPPASSTSQIMGKMMNEMVQYAMNFANDSMHTSLCLQFPPQSIATACVYLAGNFAKVRPVSGRDWLDILGHPDVEALASITVQILELVTERRGAALEAFDKIRQDIETLKEEKGCTANDNDTNTNERDSKRPRVG